MKKFRIRFGFKTLVFITLLAAGGAWWYVIGYGLWLDYRDRNAFRSIPKYELDQSKAARLSNSTIEGLVTIIGDSRLKHWHNVHSGYPLSNGRYVSDGLDGTIRFWDLENGKTVHTLFADQVLASGDGSRYFTRSGEQIRVCDSAGDVPICEAVLPQNSKKNLGAGWASNETGSKIAIVRNFEILIFDVAKSAWSVKKINGVDRPRCGPCPPFFDASGKWLLVPLDSKIYLLSLNDDSKHDGEAEFVEMEQVRNSIVPITAIVQSPDPQVVFISDMRGKLGKLNLEDRQISEIPPEHISGVGGLAIQGDHLLYDHWDTIQSRSVKDITAKSKWAESYLNLHFLNQDLEDRIIGGRENRLHIWKEGEEITPGIHDTWNPTCIDFSFDGWSLAVGGDDGVIRIYRVGSWHVVREMKFGEKPIISICYSRSGQLAVRDDSRVVLFQNEKGNQIFESSAGVFAHHAMAFSNNGRLFAFGTDNGGRGSIEVVAVNGGSKTISLSIPVNESNVPGFLRLKENARSRLNILGNIFFAPSNEFVFGTSAFQNVSIWDAKSGDFLQNIGKPEFLAGIRDAKATLSPDGRFIVMQSVSGAFGVWHGFDGDSLTNDNKPIHYFIENDVRDYDFCFSNSGSHLASVTDDGFLRIRDTQEFEIQHSIQLSGPGSKIHSVKYSHADRYIATLNGNGTIYIIRNPSSATSN